MADVLPPTPGKLMIAGEYAVMRDGGACLAAAVGELVHARLGAISPRPTIRLTAFGQTMLVPLPSAGVALAEPAGLGRFVAGALAFLQQRHGLTLLRDVDLRAAGAVGGSKVGLGTSAAVTIATVRAVLASQPGGEAWPAADVAACARAIHLEAQGERGSGYDVTTIALGGTVAYRRSPDRGESLPWPAGLHAAALYCGQPAPTAATLARGTIADSALDAIQAAAGALMAHWPTAVAADLVADINTCEAAFQRAAATAPWLWTPPMAALHEVVRAAGCVARTSGAGAGDCVLAFAADPDLVARAVLAWQARGGSAVARLPDDIAPCP